MSGQYIYSSWPYCISFCTVLNMHTFINFPYQADLAARKVYVNVDGIGIDLVSNLYGCEISSGIANRWDILVIIMIGCGMNY